MTGKARLRPRCSARRGAGPFDLHELPENRQLVQLALAFAELPAFPPLLECQLGAIANRFQDSRALARIAHLHLELLATLHRARLSRALVGHDVLDLAGFDVSVRPQSQSAVVAKQRTIRR